MTDIPDRIVRMRDLPQYLGLGKTKVKKLVADGELEVFTIAEGGRARGALASNIAAYQQRRLEASRAKKKAKQGGRNG
jgi:hypothetical protein